MVLVCVGGRVLEKTILLTRKLVGFRIWRHRWCKKEWNNKNEKE